LEFGQRRAFEDVQSGDNAVALTYVSNYGDRREV